MLGSCSRNGSIAVSKKRNMVQNPPGIAATAGFKSEAANKRMRTETMRGCGFRRPDASASSQAAITVNAWPIGHTPAVGADGVRNCVEIEFIPASSCSCVRVQPDLARPVIRARGSADTRVNSRSQPELSSEASPAKVLYVGDSRRGDEPAQQCHSLPAIEADAREVLCIHGRRGDLRRLVAPQRAAQRCRAAAGSRVVASEQANRRLSMNEALVVRRESHIAAPPATVFAFLTDPDKILRWMGTEATTETHPGGLYLVAGHRPRQSRARPIPRGGASPSPGLQLRLGG